MDIRIQRILGNWLTAFLSPLMGSMIVFNLDFIPDQNHKILLSALVSSMVVTGLIIAKTLENDKSGGIK